MEIVISRMRYISAQREQNDPDNKLRIIGLSASLANAREIGCDWMGVPSKGLFNFSPKVRPQPLEIYFQSFEQNNYSGRLMAMAKPVYDAVERYIDRSSAIVYVPSRRQAQLTAIDIMTYQESRVGKPFLGEGAALEEITAIASEIREPTLQQVLSSGIGFLFDGMVESDWTATVDLFMRGVLRVLVCPFDLCWKAPCVAHLIVIMGTEYYDGREKRHVDYPVVDLLHMMGRHKTDSSGKCVLLCHAPKKEYIKKLLYDPLPVESHLDSYLHDHFNSEIVTKTIETMQDAVDYLTWSFLYRRLPKNPTYYGLRGTSSVYLSEHLSEMVETVLGDLVGP
jgi:pre-mRNA-splicing helicase BRR2